MEFENLRRCAASKSSRLKLVNRSRHTNYNERAVDLNNIAFLLPCCKRCSMECLLPSFKRCGTIFITWKKQGYIKAAAVQLASLHKKSLEESRYSQQGGTYVQRACDGSLFYFSWDQCGIVKVHRGRSALKDTLLWRGSKENQVSFSQPFFGPPLHGSVVPERCGPVSDSL